MNKEKIFPRLSALHDIQINLRRQIGITEKKLKALKKELKQTEKEMFDLRSTKEYEENVIHWRDCEFRPRITCWNTILLDEEDK